MYYKTDKDNNSLLSTSKKSADFNKTLRIYTSQESYLDLTLYQFNANEIYFVKDTKTYAELRKLQSSDFFSFINQFTDDKYMLFLQEKHFMEFGFELDQSFPDIVVPSFERDSYLDFSTKMDISDMSLLDDITFNTKKNPEDNLVNIELHENQNFTKKQQILKTDDKIQIKDFVKKVENESNQVNKAQAKLEKKKQEKRIIKKKKMKVV